MKQKTGVVVTVLAPRNNVPQLYVNWLTTTPVFARLENISSGNQKCNCPTLSILPQCAICK